MVSRNFKLTQYKQMFLENGYDDLEVTAAITSNELCEIGVNLLLLLCFAHLTYDSIKGRNYVVCCLV